MRTSLIVLLLASAAAPAAASAEQRTDRDERAERRAEERAERAEQREERARPERAEQREERARPERAERAPDVERAPRAERAERAERTERADRPERLDRQERPAVQLRDRDTPVRERGERSDRATPDSVRDWRRGERQERGTPPLVDDRGQNVPERMREWRERQLERQAERGGRIDRTPPISRTPPVVSTVPRENTQPPPRQARRPSTSPAQHWRGEWRHDRRYDWRSWRNRNRSLFSLSFYFDPFGWSYRPYGIGWRMWPHYYRSRYWLSDPWSYRLPYAPPGYRWIRYYDDVVLVDTWDGRVVDVIYNFFW